MIYSITYGNEKYKRAKKFNCKMAKKNGADRVIAYGPEDISDEFKKKNEQIWEQTRGGGYWIWKPYIINETLKKMTPDDYLIYTDAGAIFIKSVHHLIDVLEKENTDLMVFSLTHPEKKYTKRDAFILLDCDEVKYVETPQILATYIVLKKTDTTVKIIQEYLRYVQDARIVTDIPNQMGKENYPEFVENRHDQSCLSLLCKKYGIKPFRDPSQYGNQEEMFSEEVIKRSQYPQVLDSFRNPEIGNWFQYKNINKRWYKWFFVDSIKIMRKLKNKLFYEKK